MFSYIHAIMPATKEKRPYTLQRDFKVLEREKRVTKILASHAFRAELEGILQGQLEGPRGPPKTSHALQDNLAAAAATEAGHMHAAAASVAGARAVLPINDLRGARSSCYVLSERRLRCKLASLCRLVDWFKWSPLVNNHLSVSIYRNLEKSYYSSPSHFFVRPAPGTGFGGEGGVPH